VKRRLNMIAVSRVVMNTVLEIVSALRPEARRTALLIGLAYPQQLYILGRRAHLRVEWSSSRHCGAALRCLDPTHKELDASVETI
jgi:hypothetical protein